MTQQNAALVEEASAAGEAMAEQSRGMMQLMDFFTIDHNSRAPQMQMAAPTASAPMNQPMAAPSQNHGAQMSNSDDDEWQEF